MKRILTLLIFFHTLCAIGYSQSESCYQVIRSTGVTLYNNRDYVNALQQFWAAKRCGDIPEDNDLDKKIEETTKALLGELNGRERRAQEARNKIEKAQAEAAIARNAAAEFKNAALANEAEAVRQGKLAESRRLALLADIARLRGEKGDALLLSYLALQLSDEKSQDDIYAAFASAVKDSLSKVLFVANEDIGDIQMLSGPSEWLSAQTKAQLLVNGLSDHNNSLSEAQLLASHWLGQNPIWVFAERSGLKAFIWQPGYAAPLPLQGHTDRITAAFFSPDGQWIVTCSRDHTARIWSSAGSAKATLRGHKGNIYQAGFSASGERLFTRSSDGTIGLWDLDGRNIAMLNQQNVYVYQAGFSPDGNKVIAATAHGLQLWSASNGQLSHTFGQNGGAAKEALFFQNGEKIASRHLDNTLRIWSANGEQLAVLNHPDILYGFCISPDQQKILTWSADQLVRLWDANGQLLNNLPGHQGDIISASFSPDSQLILSTSNDGTARLWSYTGVRLTEWNLGAQQPVPGVFLPKAGALITAEQNNRAVIYCPLPNKVFNQMQSNASQYQQAIDAMQTKYDIRFFR